jgi:endonuclease III
MSGSRERRSPTAKMSSKQNVSRKPIASSASQKKHPQKCHDEEHLDGKNVTNNSGTKKSAGGRVAKKKVTNSKVVAKKTKSNAASTKVPASKRGQKALPTMAPAQVRTAFERWRELNPHPTTELEYSTPFELLIAVVLSAQATDVGVNKATRRLFPVANTPQAIASLGVETLKTYISTIGLFNTKAANVIALCEKLLAEHGGEVPRERDALQALPGVGRKTANVVLNTAFGEPTMAVDTHIFRVANRIGLAPGKDVLAVEKALLQRVPQEFLQDAHHWLILHGRYTCKALKPECWRCPIRDVCLFSEKTESKAQ